MASFIDQFRPLLFCGMDRSKLDVERDANQIIARVAERGDLDEWRTTRVFYGDERIRSVVTSLRYLSRYSVALCCAVLDLKKDDFHCLTPAQLPPGSLELLRSICAKRSP